MTCAQALLSLMLFAPCQDGEVAVAGDGGGRAGAIGAAVANPARPDRDVARDANRKPAAVLSFFGIMPGMSVLELFAGSGYYTQILDDVVGPDGQLLAHNNQAYLGFVGEEFEARFANGGLPNTQRLIAEAGDIHLPDRSLDAALMVLTWHDFLYGEEEYDWPDVDEAALVNTLCAALKPGAVLGIVDHVANPGGDASAVASELHRIDPARIKADLEGSCFSLAGESDLLRNPDDDHTTSAISAPQKGHTDRFVLKYTHN